MGEKKKAKDKAQIDEVEQLHELFGFTHNDARAMLAHAAEVHTVDEIPLQRLKDNLEVDSNAYKLNQIPGSIQLERNGPR